MRMFLACGAAVCLALAPASASGKSRSREYVRSAPLAPPHASGPAQGGRRGGAERAGSRLYRYDGSTTVLTRETLDAYQPRTACDALTLIPGVFGNGCR